MINAMVQGPRKLINNTVFPAAYVAIGHLLKIQEKLPTISWDNITDLKFNYGPKNITDFFLEKLESLKDHFPSNSTTLFPNGTVLNGDFFSNAQQSFSSLQNHYYEIGTAAAIGATATIVNAILARTPGIKHWPKTRLVTAIVLSTAGVMAGAKFGLEQDINPQMILNIAIKVGIVGAGTKVAVVTIRASCKVIRGSTDIISRVIRKACNGVIFLTNRLDWGSWPTGPNHSPSEKQKEVKENPKETVQVVKNNTNVKGHNSDSESEDEETRDSE